MAEAPHAQHQSYNPVVCNTDATCCRTVDRQKRPHSETKIHPAPIQTKVPPYSSGLIFSASTCPKEIEDDQEKEDGTQGAPDCSVDGTQGNPGEGVGQGRGGNVCERVRCVGGCRGGMGLGVRD